MRIVVQRVKQARLVVQDREIGRIGTGLALLVGFGHGDHRSLPMNPIWSKLLDKIVSLRIFPDYEGKSNLNLADVEGSVLVASQFTLYAAWQKGRRPSFTPAAPPETAQALFDHFVHDLTFRSPGPVVSGIFGQDTDIELCNWGPFTLLLDSEDLGAA